MRNTIVLPNFVIANGATSSNVLDVFAAGLQSSLGSLTIVPPGTLPETVNIMISLDGGTTYGKLGSAFTAGTAICLGDTAIPACTHIKLLAGGAVAAARTFNVGISEDI